MNEFLNYALFHFAPNNVVAFRENNLTGDGHLYNVIVYNDKTGQTLGIGNSDDVTLKEAVRILKDCEIQKPC
jgi:hypothetical protein